MPGSPMRPASPNRRSGALQGSPAYCCRNTQSDLQTPLSPLPQMYPRGHAESSVWPMMAMLRLSPAVKNTMSITLAFVYRR